MQNPKMSSNFDADTCLARLRRDKAAVIRKSFELAASCIIESLDRTDDEDDIESVNEEHLPLELQDIPNLEKLRNESLERSRNNKEYAKRKTVESKAAGPKTTPGKSKTNKKADTAPKFTRNTPASSAAALDARLTSSHAILCTAANVAFEALTPGIPGISIDVSDVPQNPTKNADSTASSVGNMGAVVVEAQALGRRIESVATNAALRTARRYQFRKENLRYDRSPTSVLQVRNPFAWKDDDDLEMSTDDDHDEHHAFNPKDDSITNSWNDVCLPRFMSILQKGVGHAFYHDVDWKNRHGRISSLLQELASQDSNFGPHLIITVEPDVERFAREFRALNSHLRLMSTVDTESLRAISYIGSSEQRKRLRKKFPEATGLAEAPFHVLITSYANFLQDYLHFCQIPFEAVVVDDGVAWMAAANADPNSPLGTVWDSALFSKNDHQMGLADIKSSDWDFSVDELDKEVIKDAWIGLTARHRILTSSTTRLQQRASAESIPVAGLINFVSPHFADAVREEWDRSRISNDPASMQHFRKLLARVVVVHSPSSTYYGDLKNHELALQSLQGELKVSEHDDEPVPDLISDDAFVDNGKVSQSRKAALHWLGPIETSWLRYELGLIDFKSILEAMKASSSYGHLCEEIITASSTTTSGATGHITGTLAYRLAMRCCRHFGSEQGLRQHHSAMHAPPGTWLCRTCGSDCVTSQARTHHERSCGQPTAGEGENDGVTPPTGGSRRGKPHGPPGVVGKKKGSKTTPKRVEEKDADGSIRVSGYRGVWVNQAGKYFVKINGERLQGESFNGDLFPGVEEAAKRHDEELRATQPEGKTEYNFKEDGTRIVYEDVSKSSTSGLGGGAASVVPALSVINIKDLPTDVKPLLRDPRQTSRTGGNSKRFVYSYRGVCRQSRKGHDRWQSQISFMGVNHYLGTFDSEWDAAAIYAWAHLILYGEEATKQAQKEGEEAAAAYEKEKRDIAAGIIPTPAPKSEKKQKGKPGKKKADATEATTEGGTDKANENKPTKKRGRAPKDDTGGEKKRGRTAGDKESIAPILAKSAGKAAALAPRQVFAALTDTELEEMVSQRLAVARKLNYAVTDLSLPAPVRNDCRPCATTSLDTSPTGGAMLLGLSAALFGWNSEAFLETKYFASDEASKRAESTLQLHYEDGGENEKLRTLIQGTNTIIGCASSRAERAYSTLHLSKPQIGGVVGTIDCHIGGGSKACSESAASIRYYPSQSGEFQFSALSDNDVVTMNGHRITSGMGSFPLFNEDVCTVGPRVFVFILPVDT